MTRRKRRASPKNCSTCNLPYDDTSACPKCRTTRPPYAVIHCVPVGSQDVRVFSEEQLDNWLSKNMDGEFARYLVRFRDGEVLTVVPIALPAWPPEVSTS